MLKVYKSDQTFKYLLVHKETTAHEVVMLSLQEFGITETSSNFSLCEVSVAEGGFVKQRTLPDPLQNLAERIGLASRYFYKNVFFSILNHALNLFIEFPSKVVISKHSCNL